MKVLAIVSFAACLSVIHGTFVDVCPVNPKYILCTLHNKNVAGSVTFDLTDIIEQGPIFVIIHGWGEDSSEPWIAKIGRVLLETHKDSNIIIVDYGKYAKNPNYFAVHCAVPGIAEVLAKKCRELEIPVESVYMFGYELGAQVAGAVAREIRPLKFQAIVAVDAIGNGFEESKSILGIFQHPSVQSGDANIVVGLFSYRNCRGMKTNYADVNVFIFDQNDLNCQSNCALETPFTPCYCCDPICGRQMFINAIPKMPEYIARKCKDFESYDWCIQNTPFVIEALVNPQSNPGQYFIAVDYECEIVP